MYVWSRWHFLQWILGAAELSAVLPSWFYAWRLSEAVQHYINAVHFHIFIYIECQGYLYFVYILCKKGHVSGFIMASDVNTLLLLNYYVILLLFLFSSPEHAHGELLGSCDVPRTCGRPSCPSVKFLLVFTQEGTVFIRSTWNFVRMLVFMKFRSSAKLDHVGSKTRSLRQILEKPCFHCKRHSFDPKFM